MDSLSQERERWSAARFVPGDAAGHYESWFQRANHPSRPAGVLDPLHDLLSARSARGRRGRAVGDPVRRRDEPDHRGEAGASDRAVSFLGGGLDVRIGQAELSSRALAGAAAARGHRLAWQLAYAGDEPPLLLLPRAMYARGFPRAKAVVAAAERGLRRLARDRRRARRGRRLARQPEPQLGQPPHRPLCLGPGRGLRRRAGRLPRVLDRARAAGARVDPMAHARRAARRRPRAGAERSAARGARPRAHRRLLVELRHARRRACASARASRRPPAPSWRLRYANPPGGEKICLNTKLASCELVLEETGRPPRSLRTARRAAFEILTDEPAPEVPIVA